ncbi:MAG: c-type cytochrome [Bacteroidota bacterium]
MKASQIIAVAFIGVLFAACNGNENHSAANNTAVAETPVTTPPPIGSSDVPPADVSELLNKHTCLTCHDTQDKIVGPSFKLVAQKNYSAEQIVQLIHEPKPENWPDYPAMAPLPNVPKDDALKIANWINSLK